MDFFLEVVAFEIAQGKGAEGTLRLEPDLQAGPEEGREDRVEMEVQFGLRTGLVVQRTIERRDCDDDRNPAMPPTAASVPLPSTAVECSNAMKASLHY